MLRGRSVRPLDERQSTSLLDRFEAERSIAAGAGQYDADGILSQSFGKRAEQHADRAELPRLVSVWIMMVHVPVAEGHDDTRRWHVNVIRLQGATVGCLLHRHRGPAADQLR